MPKLPYSVHASVEGTSQSMQFMLATDLRLSLLIRSNDLVSSMRANEKTFAALCSSYSCQIVNWRRQYK